MLTKYALDYLLSIPTYERSDKHIELAKAVAIYLDVPMEHESFIESYLFLADWLRNNLTDHLDREIGYPIKGWGMSTKYFAYAIKMKEWIDRHRSQMAADLIRDLQELKFDIPKKLSVF